MRVNDRVDGTPGLTGLVLMMAPLVALLTSRLDRITERPRDRLKRRAVW